MARPTVVHARIVPRRFTFSNESISAGLVLYKRELCAMPAALTRISGSWPASRIDLSIVSQVSLSWTSPGQAMSCGFSEVVGVVVVVDKVEEEEEEEELEVPLLFL